MRQITVKARNLVSGDVIIDANGRHRKIKDVHFHKHTDKIKGEIVYVYPVILDRNARGLEFPKYTQDQFVKIKRSKRVSSQRVNASRNAKLNKKN